MNKSQQTKCKLCQREGKLHKSHIIPKVHFKNIKDTDGKYAVMNEDCSTQQVSKEYWERMLCCHCEAFLNEKYEKFGNHLFSNYLSPETNGKLTILKYKGNYEKIYFYFLSIIWRAIMSQGEFYKALGSNRELLVILSETVRLALLNEKMPVLPESNCTKGRFSRLDKRVPLRISKLELFEPRSGNNILEITTPPWVDLKTGNLTLMLGGFLIEFLFCKDKRNSLSRKNNKIPVLKGVDAVLPIKDIVLRFGIPVHGCLTEEK